MPEYATTFPRPVGSASIAPGAPPPPHHKDWFLVFCRALNVITALCLILCAAAFGMAVVLRTGGETPKRDAYLISGQLVRLFGISLSLLAVFVESEWRFVLKLVPLMDLWLARGLCYLFISALTFREAYPAEEMTDFQKSLQLYRSAASISLASCSTKASKAAQVTKSAAITPAGSVSVDLTQSLIQVSIANISYHRDVLPLDDVETIKIQGLENVDTMTLVIGEDDSPETKGINVWLCDSVSEALETGFATEVCIQDLQRRATLNAPTALPPAAVVAPSWSRFLPASLTN